MGYEESVNIKTFVGACLRLQGLATALDLQTLHFDVKNSMLNQNILLEELGEILFAFKIGVPEEEEEEEEAPDSAKSLASPERDTSPVQAPQTNTLPECSEDNGRLPDS